VVYPHIFSRKKDRAGHKGVKKLDTIRGLSEGRGEETQEGEKAEQKGKGKSIE